MQLLSKNDIDKKKSDEKRIEIEQGITLAKKVDKLRQIHNDSEQKFNKFYQETVEQYHKDISLLSKEKEGLVNENTLLKQERELLRIPLDMEWENVRIKETETNLLLENNNKLKNLLLEKENTLNEKQVVLNEKINEVDKKLANLNVELDNVGKLKQQISVILRETENDKEKFNIQYSDRLRYLEEKERKLTYDIEHNKTFTNTLKMKERELKNRETKLAFYERQYESKTR